MYIEQHSRYQNKANNIQLRYDDKQFHTTVIKDVLLWIEHNLDQSLLLDDVANKAGYTKWYFQRLFKKVTGVTLASYIRARRLTKAAVELRLTKKTILEIALKYQFDSQQSFTRRFKYTPQHASPTTLMPFISSRMRRTERSPHNFPKA
ncbi:right origin-binding protein [Salmonella enterica subsp. enterica serovar Typhi]|nr:right origin-binding protein [Salmonella enterica subsp. enterica serovar Typhi]